MALVLKTIEVDESVSKSVKLEVPKRCVTTEFNPNQSNQLSMECIELSCYLDERPIAKRTNANH